MKSIIQIYTMVISICVFNPLIKKQTMMSMVLPATTCADTTKERWKKFIDLRTYTIPFWATDTITDETVQVTRDSSLATSGLLFKAKKIISVRSADYSREFVKGTDWDYKNGQIIFGSGSRVPFFHKDELIFTKEIPGHSMAGSTPGTYVLFNEGHFFSSRQIAVTYIKDTAQWWKGPVPEFNEMMLPNSVGKMKRKEKFRIVFYGNSIEAGYNASGRENVAPFMPTWPELVIRALEEKYKYNISFVNNSVAGRLAQWGKDSVATRVIAEKPDLVIIGFGMNDGTSGVTVDVYRSQIKGIIDSVSIQNPRAEFILIAPMLANPASTFSGLQSLYKKELDTLKKPGVVVADITGVHLELLKHKSYQDMTGNNINHPNDYLARWYAQFICGFLID